MKPAGGFGAPLATLLLAAAGIAALPLSLHFEDEATAEPFLVVLPVVALPALVGAVIAWRRRTVALLVLNALAAAIALLWWISLVTYPGG